MKVNFIGTGTMGSTTRGNQSLLVDNVLFDIGSGVVKKIESLKIYTKTIKYLIITHFHADHFLDITNYLIGRNIRNENKELVYIIGGIGLRKKVIELFQFTFGDGKKNKYKEFEKGYNVEFIELEDGQTFENDEIKLTAYELQHGLCKPILGFVLEKDNKKIGYATDTVLCDNVKKICENSDYVFLDATNTVPSGMHMGVNQVIQLKNEYSNKKIYAIHRSDYVHSHIKEIEFPEDGDEIEI